MLHIEVYSWQSTLLPSSADGLVFRVFQVWSWLLPQYWKWKQLNISVSMMTSHLKTGVQPTL